MRGKGINYDTGFFPGGQDSRPDFDPETARKEIDYFFKHERQPSRV